MSKSKKLQRHRGTSDYAKATPDRKAQSEGVGHSGVKKMLGKKRLSILDKCRHAGKGQAHKTLDELGIKMVKKAPYNSKAMFMERYFRNLTEGMSLKDIQDKIRRKSAAMLEYLNILNAGKCVPEDIQKAAFERILPPPRIEYVRFWLKERQTNHRG